MKKSFIKGGKDSKIKSIKRKLMYLFTKIFSYAEFTQWLISARMQKYQGKRVVSPHCTANPSFLRVIFIYRKKRNLVFRTGIHKRQISEQG